MPFVIKSDKGYFAQDRNLYESWWERDRTSPDILTFNTEKDALRFASQFVDEIEIDIVQVISNKHELEEV